MLTEAEERKALYSAASWITVSKTEIELIPNKNEKIFYKITVPEDITKGEYTAIVAFISDTQAKSLRYNSFHKSFIRNTILNIKLVMNL